MPINNLTSEFTGYLQNKESQIFSERNLQTIDPTNEFETEETRVYISPNFVDSRAVSKHQSIDEDIENDEDRIIIDNTTNDSRSVSRIEPVVTSSSVQHCADQNAGFQTNQISADVSVCGAINTSSKTSMTCSLPILYEMEADCNQAVNISCSRNRSFSSGLQITRTEENVRETLPKEVFMCMRCKNSFSTIRSLRIHDQFHCRLTLIKSLSREVRQTVNSSETKRQKRITKRPSYSAREINLETPKKTRKQKIVPGHCDFCSKSFSSQYYLKDHLKFHCKSSPRTPRQQCIKCDINYKNPKTMQKHLLYGHSLKVSLGEIRTFHTVSEDCNNIFITTANNHKNSCISNSEYSCIPKSQNSCTPNSEYSCIPKSQNSCIPNNEYSCIPKSQNSCIPSSEYSCIPNVKESRIDEEFSDKSNDNSNLANPTHLRQVDNVNKEEVIKRFACNVCSEAFYFRDSLADHLQNHLYQCYDS